MLVCQVFFRKMLYKLSGLFLYVYTKLKPPIFGGFSALRFALSQSAGRYCTELLFHDDFQELVAGDTVLTVAPLPEQRVNGFFRSRAESVVVVHLVAESHEPAF